MCDLVVLSRWINASLRSKQPFARHLLQAQAAEVLDLAEHAGIFRNVGLQTHVTCTACDDPHASPVERLPDGQLGYLCLENGWIELNADQVKLVRFDRAALLNAMASASGLRKVNATYYADGRLVYLGFVTATAWHPNWVLGYADKLDDENVFAGVMDALWNRFPSGPGFIVTPSAVNLNSPLPQQLKLVALHELYVGEGRQIHINPEVVWRRLGRRKEIPGKRGRPGKIEVTKQVWTEARRAADWPQARSLQAEYILNKWPSDQRPPPSAGTIENHLREFENEKAAASEN